MKVLFLDESGDHNLSVIDPSYPIFVLGGVIKGYGLVMLSKMKEASPRYAVTSPHIHCRCGRLELQAKSFMLAVAFAAPGDASGKVTFALEHRPEVADWRRK